MSENLPETGIDKLKERMEFHAITLLEDLAFSESELDEFFGSKVWLQIQKIFINTGGDAYKVIESPQATLDLIRYYQGVLDMVRTIVDAEPLLRSKMKGDKVQFAALDEPSRATRASRLSKTEETLRDVLERRHGNAS